jgi:hypothetical protein
MRYGHRRRKLEAADKELIGDGLKRLRRSPN